MHDYELTKTKYIYDPTFKGGLHVWSNSLYNDIPQSANGSLIKRILKDRLFHQNGGIELPRNHKLFDIVDRKIQQLFTGGIIMHYDEKYARVKDPKIYEHFYQYKAEVLTLQKLEAGFIIWLFALFLALVAFICEWIKQRFDHFIVKTVITALYGVRISEALTRNRNLRLQRFLLELL